MLLIDNCLLERQGRGRGGVARWAEREKRRESERRGDVYRREERVGEVGDGGKEGDITREEGFGGGFRRWSEIEKELLLSTPFAFITVHTCSPHIPDCLCHPTFVIASRQSTPVSGTI